MSRHVPVSVVIPAYNAENFLHRAVATVRSQTVDVQEIIIVDDESTDRTAAVAERLGATVLRARHGGPAGARNAGLAVAKADWIATLDADDVWHPRKLELQYDAVRAESELGLVFTDFDTVSAADGRIHKHSVVSDNASFNELKRRRLTPQADLLDFADFLWELPARPIVLPSTAIFRRDLALAVGGFPAKVKAEDTEFFLRLASRAVTGFIDVPLVAYMRHAAQITANWELDPVRLELFHHVMANKVQYHEFIVRGFKKQYTNALYYCAANAASKKRFVSAFGFLAKAVAVAGVQGHLTSLAQTATQSRLLRSGLIRTPSAKSGGTFPEADDSIVRDIDIPWRRRDFSVAGVPA
jgi:glycosyltransferase involved in cell wall biosynthesis